jgi:hypothetical protein
MDSKSIIFTFIFSYLLLPLLLAYIFVSYIKSLENKKCACSNDVRRKYVKYYGYFLFGFSLLGLIVVILAIKNPKAIMFNNFLKIMAILVNFLAAYLLYDYDKILDNNNCECSNSWKKVFIKYYAYVIIFITGFMFFSMLLLFIKHIMLQEDKYMIELRNIFTKCS